MNRSHAHASARQVRPSDHVARVAIAQVFGGAARFKMFCTASTSPVHISGLYPHLGIGPNVYIMRDHDESVTRARERAKSVSLQNGLWGLDLGGPQVRVCESENVVIRHHFKGWTRFLRGSARVGQLKGGHVARSRIILRGGRYGAIP